MIHIKRFIDKKYSFSGRNNTFPISSATMKECINKIIIITNTYPTKSVLDELINGCTNHLNETICFSKNLTKGLFTSPTVAYSAIQILYNLGYDYVNIFGLDLTDSGRFYDSDAGQSLDKHNTRIFLEMSLCSQTFSENHKHIINRSPNSALPTELMPQGDIVSFFKKS